MPEWAWVLTGFGGFFSLIVAAFLIVLLVFMIRD